MSVSETEFKTNLGKYLELSATEDIYITKNGSVVAKLTNPFSDRRKIVESLIGVLPTEASLEEAKEERLRKI